MSIFARIKSVNKIKLIFFVSFLLFALLAMVSLWTKKFAEDDTSLALKALELQRIDQAARKIDSWWREGVSVSRYLQSDHCQEFTLEAERYGERILECNPEVIKCLLSKELPDLLFSWRWVHFTEFLQVETFGKKVTISSAHHTRTLLLPHTCHELTLLAGKYPLAASDGDRQNYWENHQQKIKVDKFQVNWRDFKLWKSFIAADNPLDPRQMRESEQKYSPAYGMTRQEMRDFCQFFGKELLSSHVFDAISLFPRKLEREGRPHFNLSPIPWSHRASDGHLYQAQQWKKQHGADKRFEVDWQMCQRVFSYECLDRYAEKLYQPLSPTWSGAFQVLGGYMEAVENKISPRSNLVPSSFYFKAASSMHQLTKRIYWDGQGHKARNFNWQEYPVNEEDHFKVAFRCMRDISQ